MRVCYGQHLNLLTSCIYKLPTSDAGPALPVLPFDLSSPSGVTRCLVIIPLRFFPLMTTCLLGFNLCVVFFMSLFIFSGCFGTHNVEQAGLELAGILLPSSPRAYAFTPSHGVINLLYFHSLRRARM